LVKAVGEVAGVWSLAAQWEAAAYRKNGVEKASLVQFTNRYIS